MFMQPLDEIAASRDSDTDMFDIQILKLPDASRNTRKKP